MEIQTRERPTIMDGKVVTFASQFTERGYGSFQTQEALGPFEVSASRNAVVVHRAECKTPEQVEALIEAIRQAEATRKRLQF